MRYPHDSWEKWYIASGFGQWREKGQYYHDGADINLLTGGDSDFGQPIKAIANGVVTSVHEHTGNPTFGLHIHYKIETPFGPRWVHSAHCKEVFMKVGDMVSEGQSIATVGKSGTDIAHHHFAIKKALVGTDGIAKTKEDLAKWEDPIPFIEKCIQKEQECEEVEGLKEMLKTRDNQIVEANTRIEGLEEQVRQNESRYNSFLDRLWEKLDPLTIGEKGEATILGEVEKLITVEDEIRKAQKKNEELQKEYDEFVKEVAKRLDIQPTSRTAVLEALGSLVEATKEQQIAFKKAIEELEVLRVDPRAAKWFELLLLLLKKIIGRG